MFSPTVKSLKDVLQEHDSFEFLEYAQQAGLSEVLEWKKETNMTILVPSAEAFSSTNSDKHKLQSILRVTLIHK